MLSDRQNRYSMTEVLEKMENLLVEGSKSQELNIDKKVIIDILAQIASIHQCQPAEQAKLLKALNVKIVALRENLFDVRDQEIYLIDKKNESVVNLFDKLLTCINDGLLILRKNKDKKNLSVKFKEETANLQTKKENDTVPHQADVTYLGKLEIKKITETQKRMLHAKQNQDNNLKTATNIASSLHDIAGKDINIKFSSGGNEKQPDPAIEIQHNERLNKTELKALIKTFEAKAYAVQSKKNVLILRPSTEEGYFTNFDPKGFILNYLSHLKTESNSDEFLNCVKNILERLNLNARDAVNADVGVITHEGKLKIGIILSIKNETEKSTLKNLDAALTESKILTTANTENALAIVSNQTGIFDVSRVNILEVIRNYNIESFETTRKEYNSKVAAKNALWPSIKSMNRTDPTANERPLQPQMSEEISRPKKIPSYSKAVASSVLWPNKPTNSADSSASEQPLESPLSKGIDGLKQIASQELYRLIVDGRLHAKEQGWYGYASREMNCLPAVFEAMKVAFNNLSNSAVTLYLIKDIHAAACRNVTGIGEFAAHHPGELRNKHSGFKLDLSYMNEEGFYELYDFVKQNADKGCFLSVVNNTYLDKLSSSEDFNDRFEKLTPSSLSKEELWNIIVNERNDPSENRKIVNFRAPRHEYVEKMMSAACDNYNRRIYTAKTIDEKIKLMAQLTKMLEWIHGFSDVNGRTNTLLLQRLLIQNGSLPTMMFNPNYIDGYDLSSLINEIKRGIKMTQQSIETPNEPIYDYRTKKIRCYDAPETREGKIIGGYNKAVESLHTHIQSINTSSIPTQRPR